MEYNSIISDAQLYLSLQETSGTIAGDTSGKGRDGTLINGLDFGNTGLNGSVAGPRSWLPRALRTDTAERKIEVADHPNLRGGGQMSLCGWVNRYDLTADQWIAIISKAGSSANRDYSLQWQNPARNPPITVNFAAEINNNTLSHNYEYNENGWHFLAATYDSVGGDCKLYIDGNLVSTINDPGLSDSSTTPVTIFGLGYTIGSLNERSMDLAGVGMWNHILTDQQIRLLYLGPNYPVGDFVGKLYRSGSEAGLVQVSGGSESGLVNSI